MRCARAILFGEFWSIRFPVIVLGPHVERLDRMCRALAEERSLIVEVKDLERRCDQYASWLSGDLRLTTGEIWWWCTRGEKARRANSRAAFWLNQRAA